MPRTHTRTVRALVAATLLAGTGVALAPPALAEPECLSSSFDLDLDYLYDDVVGSPGSDVGAAADAGSVVLRMTNEDDEPYLLRKTAPDPGPGDRFGAAIAEVASYNDEGQDDRCSQLVVGAPGREVDGLDGAGAIFVYRWDYQHLELRLVGEFSPGHGLPGAPQAHAHFGASLAAPQHLESTGPVVTRLSVGAPGQDVDGVPGAGAVTSFTLSSAQTPVAQDVRTLTFGPDSVGAPSSGGALGTSLALDQYGTLFAGAPGQTAGGVRDAGAILMDDGDSVQEFSQATDRVVGDPESGDEFGAALYAAAGSTVDPGPGRYDVLIGVPGEDIGTIRDAGAVQTLPVAVYPGAELEPHAYNSHLISQNTAGVAGTAEAGDRFGASVGQFQHHAEIWRRYLAGAPGEDVGSVKDAGAVYTLAGSQSWSEKTTGVPGAMGAGDRMGATLDNTGIRYQPETGQAYTAPFVGVPGADARRGAVLVGLPATGPSVEHSHRYQPSVRRPGDAYGSALGGVD